MKIKKITVVMGIVLVGFAAGFFTNSFISGSACKEIVVEREKAEEFNKYFIQ